ncbi:MAG: DNA repair protein RecO, partial [Acidobacteria bacterium]
MQFCHGARHGFLRNSPRKYCTKSARVVITMLLRVRAFRTECCNLSGAASARRLLMPARETEAIILKTFPLGEADRLVSFLGRSSGRVRGVAAGARLLKNRYGSTLEVLSHVQIWYVEKENRELVRIQQAELLESFHKAQSDYGLSTGLAVISEIAELILPEHEVSEPMFRLILLVTREVERTSDWTLPLSYFAFWTVRLGGWLPRFDHCVVCGTAFGAKPAFYDAHQPGLFCEKCRRSGMKPLYLAARNLAERFAGERLDRMEIEKSNEPGATELREAGLSWIEHHLERR